MEEKPPRIEVKVERPHHVTAFYFWYSLGKDRNFEKVGEAMNVTGSAVRYWYKCFHWKERSLEMDGFISKNLSQEMIFTEQKSRKLQLQICMGVSAKFYQMLRDGKVEISAQDFVRVAQHELLLRGYATGRHEVAIKGGELELIIANLAKIIEDGVPQKCPHCLGDLKIREALSNGIIELVKSETMGAVFESIRPKIEEDEEEQKAIGAEANPLIAGENDSAQSESENEDQAPRNESESEKE